MDIFIFILFVLFIVGLRPTWNNPVYIGRETTTAIKGIFAICIIYSHGTQYITPEILGGGGGGKYSMLFNTVLGLTGQLMVVMFLFYSGYGIMESYIRKQGRYLDGFLSKRVLKTLFHFDIAVAAFVVLAIVLGKEYSIKQYLLSFTGWEAVGNSNWFIFDIIVLYLIAYGGLVIKTRSGIGLKHYLWIVYAGTFLFLIVLLLTRGEQTWWWDSILAFPTGMLWSVYRPKLETKIKEQRNYLIALSITLISFVGFYYLEHHYKTIFSIFTSAVFGILIVLITMRCHIGNRALHWLGVNAFAIYILQRLSMIIVAEIGLNESPLLFMAIVIPATLLIASAFTALTDRIDRRLFT